MTTSGDLPNQLTSAPGNPSVEPPVGRGYLSLGEVLDVLKEEFPDVTIAKIRFFESQGLLIPERTPSGYRKFFPADIDRLRLILADQQKRYVPLTAARATLTATGQRTASDQSEVAPRDLDRLDHDDVVDAFFADGEDVQNYDGVDLGSDRHPALRGRREPGPRLLGRRALTEARTPSLPAAPPIPNVAPLRRAAVSASSTAVGPTVSTAASVPNNPSLIPFNATEEASYSRAELLTASGASDSLFEDALKQGFVQGRQVLGEMEFDEDDCRLLQALVTMGGSGLDPRHVRVFMHAAQREADLYVQATLPLLRRRPHLGVSVEEPFRRFGDLEAAGATLRGVVVRRALRDALAGAPGPTSLDR